MNDEFNKWAGSFFSWEEQPNPRDVEACYVAWSACKNKVLNILDKYSNSADVSYIKDDVEKL